MKRFALFALLFSLGLTCFGQSTDISDNSALQNCDTTIYSVVETMPRYEGGMKALEKSLKKELKASHNIDKNVNGTMYVTFTVNCNGEAADFKAIRSRGKSADESVLSSLQSFQNWTAGAHVGTNVNCTVHLVIEFFYGKVSSFECATCDVDPSIFTK